MHKITTKVKRNRQTSFIDTKTSIIIASVYTIALIVYILFKIYV